MSENKWWLCYFGRREMCEKLVNAPQFKCSCGKMVCEAMPIVCGNVDARKHYDHLTKLYKAIESHCIGAGVL
jgi:hypothetical protein